MTRILGIVGGTGPESTVDYYRSIIASWCRRNPNGSYPQVIVNSVEGGRIFRLLGEREFSRIAEEMADAVRQLAAAGRERLCLPRTRPIWRSTRLRRLADPAEPYRRCRS